MAGITRPVPTRWIIGSAMAAGGIVLLAGLAVFSGVFGAGGGLGGPCQFQKADPGTIAFCETFDSPHPITNRSGQLNGEIWGTSRTTGDMNLDQGHAAPWPATQLVGCASTITVTPPNDIIVCTPPPPPGSPTATPPNGQLREALDDGHSVVALALYPKQPFDFAGRTGTIAFDVTDDSTGTHDVWPELWVTSKPIPAPFVHFGDWNNPEHGFALRFSACGTPGNVGVDSAAVFRNYVHDDDAISSASFTRTTLGCVKASSGANGGLNHIEVRVNTGQIDVWMSDAGSTVLKLVSRITNVNLTLTRGLVWIEDAHYNAAKGQPPIKTQHTFTWDNVGFDGPLTYRDLSYDVLDSLTVCHDGEVCLGWLTSASNPVTLNTLPITASDIAAAASQRVMFNFYSFNAPIPFSITLNGHPYNVAWPFPFVDGFGTHALSIDVNKADLVPGPQVLRIWSTGDTMVVSNVNVVLVNVGPVLPGGTPSSTTTATPTAVPATATSVATATSTPTSPPATPTPTSTPAVATSTPTSVGTPIPALCRAVYQRSLDGGATWANWYVDTACPAGHP